MFTKFPENISPFQRRILPAESMVGCSHKFKPCIHNTAATKCPNQIGVKFSNFSITLSGPRAITKFLQASH